MQKSRIKKKKKKKRKKRKEKRKKRLWINKIRSIYAMEYYSKVKKNEELIHDTHE